MMMLFEFGDDTRRASAFASRIEMPVATGQETQTAKTRGSAVRGVEGRSPDIEVEVELSCGVGRMRIGFSPSCACSRATVMASS